MNNDEKDEILLNEEKKFRALSKQSVNTEKSLEKEKIFYLKYFDPTTNKYIVKAVKKNGGVSTSSSLNDLK